jgi:hypothetical protein
MRGGGMAKPLAQMDDRRMRFIKKLLKYCFSFGRLRPKEVYIFNVIANHGSYQVTIGAEYSPAECKKHRLAPHSRKIEIRGTMHNLFVNPKSVSPSPLHEDIKTNLRGTVIMKDVTIHIVDRERMNAKDRCDSYHIRAERKVNLAGLAGEKMVEDMKLTNRLAIETYRIVQEDIIEALGDV